MGWGMPRESGGMIFIPRPHQLAARDAILAARREGRPGFLLGDLTGLGKTLSVWAALAAMPFRRRETFRRSGRALRNHLCSTSETLIPAECVAPQPARRANSV